MDILDIALASKLAKGKAGGGAGGSNHFVEVIDNCDCLPSDLEGYVEEGEGFSVIVWSDDEGSLPLRKATLTNGTWKFEEIPPRAIIFSPYSEQLMQYDPENVDEPLMEWRAIPYVPELHLYLQTVQLKVSFRIDTRTYTFYINFNLLSSSTIDNVSQIKNYLRDGTALNVSGGSFDLDGERGIINRLGYDGGLKLNLDLPNGGRTLYVLDNDEYSPTIESVVTKQIF